MLNAALPAEGCVMRRTIGSRRAVRSMLVANGCVALTTGAATLVVLLIAPLGLAAVVTCTVMVGLVSFGMGLVADVLLWRYLMSPEGAFQQLQKAGILRALHGRQLRQSRDARVD